MLPLVSSDVCATLYNEAVYQVIYRRMVGWVNHELERIKLKEGVVSGPIEATFWYLPEEIVGNQEYPQSGLGVWGPGFEPGTFRIQIRSGTAWASFLGEKPHLVEGSSILARIANGR